MHCLVTGGTGFIGQHLAEKLIEEQHSVTVISRRTPENPVNKVHYTSIDIQNIWELEQLFSEEQYDCVFHLAGISDIRYSLSNPRETHEANAGGTVNLLDVMRKHDVSRMIFSSTSAIYGDKSCSSNIETGPVNPLSPYAFSKYVCEQVCEMYSKLYGMQNISLRYFNAYGPSMKNTSPAVVILKFIEALANNQPPVIFGDGEQTRDFVYIDDVVRANLCAMSSKTKGTFNIGSGVSTSLNDLYAVISCAMSSQIKPQYLEKRPGDICFSGANIEKAEKQLGYHPLVNLEEGVENTIRNLL